MHFVVSKHLSHHASIEEDRRNGILRVEIADAKQLGGQIQSGGGHDADDGELLFRPAHFEGDGIANVVAFGGLEPIGDQHTRAIFEGRQGRFEGPRGPVNRVERKEHFGIKANPHGVL